MFAAVSSMRLSPRGYESSGAELPHGLARLVVRPGRRADGEAIAPLNGEFPFQTMTFWRRIMEHFSDSRDSARQDRL